MTLSANLLGNLIGRHLKHDVGFQAFNGSNGRGYLFSGDGRVGFLLTSITPMVPNMLSVYLDH
jgi:hypothetical protein